MDVLDENLLRPVAHVHHAGRQHRDAWRRFDRVLSEESRGGRWWPEYIHAPLSVAWRIAAESPVKGFGAAAQPHILAALAAWRPTQGVYRFHSRLLDELWRTPVTGDLPAELFRKLPEWCVYVEAPDRDVGPGMPIHGFFAHLAPGEGEGETLELLFDMRVPMPMLAPKRVLLNGTVEESVAELARRDLPPEIADFVDVCALGTEDVGPLSSILSLLLYLCSESPELRDQDGRRRAPGRPTAKAPRRCGQVDRFAAASKPTVWETAFELGRRLEEAQEREGEGGDQGRSVRPHVRRAHWHTYWSGPVDGPRTRNLRWMSPLLINARGGPVAPTVRKVGFGGRAGE